MRTTGVFEAKQNFSQLLEAAEAGEEVIITRHGKRIARLSPFEPQRVGAEQIEREIQALRELRARVKPGPGWKALRDEGRE